MLKLGIQTTQLDFSMHLEQYHPTECSEAQVSDDHSQQPHSSKDSSKPTHLQTKITDTYPLVEPYHKNNPRYKACEEALANVFVFRFTATEHRQQPTVLTVTQYPQSIAHASFFQSIYHSSNIKSVQTD